MFCSKIACRIAMITLVPLSAATTVDAQRVQFPTSAPPAVVNSPPTYAPQGNAVAPNYGAQPAYTQPPATFQGGVIQAPGVDWYANPGTAPAQPYYQQPGPTGPNVLYPSDPTAPYGVPGGQGGIGSYTRLFNLGIESEWLYGSGFNSFQKTSTDVFATANLFFFPGQIAPFEITPGFTYHALGGPNSVAGEGWSDAPSTDGYAELPAKTYDAYLNAGWQPEFQRIPWLSADVSARVGVYTDFDHITDDSIRITGHGLAILHFSPRVRVAMGIVYYDRLTKQLLPAGGVIWTPDEDWRFEILFPRSKVAKRISTVGNTDFWLYGGAEFYHDGGSWTVSRVSPIGTSFSDRVEYRDHRAMAGIEWRTLSGFQGFFDVGIAFSRNLKFVSTVGDAFDPDTTFFLRGGVSF